MFARLLIISIVLLAVSAIFFGIRILVKKNGTFPQTHVGRNREMRKRGISCAQDTNTGCNPTNDLVSCSTCGKNIYDHGVTRSHTE